MSEHAERTEHVEVSSGPATAVTESRFRQLADAAPAILWVTGPDGACTFLSRGWYEHTGQKEDEALGFGWLNAVHPDDREQAARAFRSASEAGVPFAFDYRLRRADGEYRWAIDAGRPLFGKSREPLGFVGSVIDIHERKQSEHDLIQSEEQLRIVTDALPALVSFIGPDLRYRFVNASYERWFGRPKESAIGRHMADVLGPEAFESIADRLRDALAGSRVTYEACIPYRTGGTRWVEATYIPQRARDGRVEGLVALVHDVTERRSLERFRSESAERTERLLKVATAIADAVTASEVYAALVDGVAEAIGASTAGLFLVDHAERQVRLVRSLGYSQTTDERFAAVPLDTEPSIPLLDVIKRQEPLWLPSQAALLERYPHLEGHVTPGRAYRFSILPLVAQDRTIGSLALTEEKEGEASREEKEFLLLVGRYASQSLERLRLFEESVEARARAEHLQSFAQAVVSAQTVEAVFEAALDTVETALDVKRAVILTFDDDEITRVRAQRGISADLQEALDGYLPWRGAADAAVFNVMDAQTEPRIAKLAPFCKKDGTTGLVFLPLAARGRLLGALMVCYARPSGFPEHEIEMVRAVANYLSSAIARFGAIAKLEDTIRFNELFAGILAHDLRNPLNAIMMAAELVLMRTGGQASESKGEAKPLSKILSSGRRMATMIEQLLDFTRVRSGGGIAIHATDTNLASLCDHVLEELALAHPDWQFRKDVRGEPKGVWDPDRLLQVVSNLVANAGQHGSEHGDIQIRVDGTKPDWMVLEVHNGGTIPPNLLPTLFDPFRTTRVRGKSQGLGLGLYIVREIVRAHGGTVTVRSSEAEGTTFTVRLPRRSATQGSEG